MLYFILYFYIGIFQSFQPTYYSGFGAFFQLSEEDKEAGTKVLASQLSLGCRARRSG